LVFSGLIWLFFAKIIAWPVWFLLNYIIKVINYLSSVPLASIEFRSFSLIFFIIYYLVLVWFIYNYAFKYKKN